MLFDFIVTTFGFSILVRTLTVPEAAGFAEAVDDVLCAREELVDELLSGGLEAAGDVVLDAVQAGSHRAAGGTGGAGVVM